MRRWVIAAAVMILVPWAVSLVWMRSVGIQAEAAGNSAAGGQADGRGNDKVLDEAERGAGDGSTGEETRSGTEGEREGEKGREGEADAELNGEGMALEAGNLTGNGEKHQEGSIQRRILVERKGIRTYIDLEDYLPGVMVCQMDGDYEMEALKCQAVIARTYVYRLMDGREEIYEEELDMDYLGEGEGSLSGDRMKLLTRLERCQEAAEAT